jgi:hypothetical protein
VWGVSQSCFYQTGSVYITSGSKGWTWANTLAYSAVASMRKEKSILTLAQQEFFPSVHHRGASLFPRSLAVGEFPRVTKNACFRQKNAFWAFQIGRKARIKFYISSYCTKVNLHT